MWRLPLFLVLGMCCSTSILRAQEIRVLGKFNPTYRVLTDTFTSNIFISESNRFCIIDSNLKVLKYKNLDAASITIKTVDYISNNEVFMVVQATKSSISRPFAVLLDSNFNIKKTLKIPVFTNYSHVFFGYSKNNDGYHLSYKVFDTLFYFRISKDFSKITTKAYIQKFPNHDNASPTHKLFFDSKTRLFNGACTGVNENDKSYLFCYQLNDTGKLLSSSLFYISNNTSFNILEVSHLDNKKIGILSGNTKINRYCEFLFKEGSSYLVPNKNFLSFTNVSFAEAGELNNGNMLYVLNDTSKSLIFLEIDSNNNKINEQLVETPLINLQYAPYCLNPVYFTKFKTTLIGLRGTRLNAMSFHWPFSSQFCNKKINRQNIVASPDLSSLGFVKSSETILPYPNYRFVPFSDSFVLFSPNNSLIDSGRFSTCNYYKITGKPYFSNKTYNGYPLYESCPETPSLFKYVFGVSLSLDVSQEMKTLDYEISLNDTFFESASISFVKTPSSDFTTNLPITHGRKDLTKVTVKIKSMNNGSCIFETPLLLTLYTQPAISNSLPKTTEFVFCSNSPNSGTQVGVLKWNSSFIYNNFYINGNLTGYGDSFKLLLVNYNPNINNVISFKIGSSCPDVVRNFKINKSSFTAITFMMPYRDSLYAVFQPKTTYRFYKNKVLIDENKIAKTKLLGSGYYSYFMIDTNKCISNEFQSDYIQKLSTKNNHSTNICSILNNEVAFNSELYEIAGIWSLEGKTICPVYADVNRFFLPKTGIYLISIKDKKSGERYNEKIYSY